MSNNDFDADDLSTTSSNSSSANSLNNLSIKEKHDKLIQEYTKTRNKLTVLKKAYIELNEKTTQKDQLIRKYEQEIDSLTFRNQQLVTRIVVLQKEIEKVQLNGGSSSQIDASLLSAASSNTESSVNVKDLFVIKEELAYKIEENANLHRKLNETESDLSRKCSDLEQLTEKFEYEKRLLQTKLANVDNDRKTLIEQLENDKIKLELRLINMEKELKEQKLIAQNAAKQAQNKSEKIEPFDIKMLFKSLENAFSSLIKLYGSIEERVIATSPSTPSKLIDLIRQSEKLLTEACNILAQNSELFDLNSFSKTYHQIIAISKQLIQEFLDRKEFTNDNLKQDIDANEKNEFDRINLKLTNILKTKLMHYLDSLNDCSLKLVEKIAKCGEHSSSDQQKYSSILSKNDFETLIKHLQQLNNHLLADVLKLLNDKLSLEHKLCVSQSLVTIDECLLFYVSQFNANLLEVITYAKDNLSSFIEKLNHSYLNKANSSTNTNPELMSKIKLLESNEKLLRQDLETITAKWNSDKNLLKTYENEIADLKARLSNNNEIQPVVISDDTILVDKKADECNNNNNNEETDELKYQLYLLDSKCVYLYEELKCVCEHYKLQLIELNNERQENVKQKQLNQQINDEVDVIRQRYEDQIRTMSEHIATMNDCLAEKTDEIDKLQTQIKTKQTSKKSK